MGRRRARLWALFQCCKPKAKAKTRRSLASDRVLEAEGPEKSPASDEEVNVYKKQLLEREEELAELRAERKNTRLLLEHVERLVSRYVPSLEMTAGKQQAQPPAGMTSELKVLRALKSLFEYHKALDEKRSSDSSESQEPDLAKMRELQEVIDKKSREQRQMKERLAAISAHVRELEKDLDKARKNVLKSEEVNTKLERDVREAMALKENMEKIITTLEKHSLAAQREAACVHDFNGKLENETADEDSVHRQTRQGEDVKEEHNKPLSDTMDKLVSESDERLQLHLKERMAALEDKVQTLKEQGWERAQQASVLANVAQAFESDEGVSDGEGDGVTLFTSATHLSPSGQVDAKTLTVTLQEQLDAINEEIRLIKEKNTELLAEETESRVGRGSLGNLRRCKTESSLNLDAASSLAGSCSPSSGRSKPQRRRRSPPREVDTTGLPAIPEEVGDIEGTTSTPASPQSLQLDQLHPGALHTASHEAIRDACNLTGSQDSPGSNPSSSSSSSSQDSPHKAAKNKSIRYSISRIFQKNPYHALLLLSDEKSLLGELPLDCSPALVRVIKTTSAVKNLQQLAQDADLALLQVFQLAAHLVYWGKAIVIYPLCENNVYMLAPNASVCLYSPLAEQFSRQFPSHDLPSVLAKFSLSEFRNPLAPPVQETQLIQMVVWMLQRRLLVQLHTYVCLMASPSEDEPRPREDDAPLATRVGGRSLSTPNALSFGSPASSDDMTLTSPSMDNSSAELLPSGDSPLNRRMTESLLASLSEHERAAILSVPAAQNPEDLRMFARLLHYFRGRHHLEEIMYNENTQHSQLLALVDKFRSVLVVTAHEDPVIAVFQALLT